ncbi:hypothetical protein Q604_UNBc4C00253G0001, partial [human gut metagenome]
LCFFCLLLDIIFLNLQESILLHLLILLNPIISFISVPYIIGSYFIISGLCELYIGFRIKWQSSSWFNIINHIGFWAWNYTVDKLGVIKTNNYLYFLP